ncbi:sigma factor-like helix-turn-helix DNA-binding protein [Neobacillus mesonae]|uniref:sigma factor-like helix-turn-helix DNA-binding protein n=1 Tax=Neobacillus mesonae TaxID=1193713 RepID=UPI00203D4560|nr:sigma factor-like helix-turn-helix DNA-binding protein [Neobacillus mesonae]MCM3567830.1 hypothetical protein [Neobacillus mesonae]
MDKNNADIEDAMFYLKMIGHGSDIGTIKPYYKILNDRNSDDFKRFISVYTKFKDSLSEKEQFVLDEIYGVNKKHVTLKTAGEMLGVGPERARQITKKAEFRMVSLINKRLKENTEE